LSFAARFAAPTIEELGALVRKYDALANLRQKRDAGGGVAPRAELFGLAREFPGALRELDTLPREEIERRGLELRAALAGGPLAPWMTWLAAYHATMRAALYIKGRLARSGRAASAAPPRGRERAEMGTVAPAATGNAISSGSSAKRLKRKGLSDDLIRRIAEDAARHSGVPVDDDFVRAVASPPARRVNAAVFERLGRELGVPADTLWQTLFPTHRARRY
jgi:hypothetical protein